MLPVTFFLAICLPFSFAHCRAMALMLSRHATAPDKSFGKGGARGGRAFFQKGFPPRKRFLKTFPFLQIFRRPLPSLLHHLPFGGRLGDERQSACHQAVSSCRGAAGIRSQTSAGDSSTIPSFPNQKIPGGAGTKKTPSRCELQGGLERSLAAAYFPT